MSDVRRDDSANRTTSGEPPLTAVDLYGSVSIGPCYYVNGEQVSKDTYDRVRGEIERLQAGRPLDLVNEQALDEGLWFVARTAPEAYLQEALRRLHDAVELHFTPRSKPLELP